MFRRYLGEHFQNQQLLPSAFQFPRQSFNREKYSTPEDVLHPDCCNGVKLSDGWGILQCSSSDLPSPIVAADGRVFEFSAIHDPTDCCYAHTELRCTEGGAILDAPSKKVRETFRVQLSQKMSIRIPAR